MKRNRGVKIQIHSINISILLREMSFTTLPFCPVVTPDTMTIDRRTVQYPNRQHWPALHARLRYLAEYTLLPPIRLICSPGMPEP